MFQRRVLAALAISMTFGTANAATESSASEFFYQTGPGKSAVTGALSYGILTTKAKGATVDEKATGISGTGLAYEYGLNEMLSFGATLTFSSVETDTGVSGATKTKESGLENPSLFVKGTSPMGMARLRYGAMLDLGLMKSKIESNGDSNAASGGFALVPYVGADADMGPGILGAKLTYAFLLERTIDFAGTEYKQTGGNTIALSAFYEYMLSDMIFSGALNYRSIGEVTTKQGGTETDKSKTLSPLGITLYARIPVEPVVLLPRLDYDFSASGDGFDKYNDMTLSLAGRFEF